LNIEAILCIYEKTNSFDGMFRKILIK